ncbi:MAG TPA: alpha/beta fold hydrolase [Cryptosporangiaceae bacterium]|nr:alpha/beta fold hydrolase [Cryptosporangiaceae bacterium]
MTGVETDRPDPAGDDRVEPALGGGAVRRGAPRPGGRPERVRAMRPMEWAFPPSPVRREVLCVLPGSDTGRPPLLFVHGTRHGAWAFAEHWLPAAAERGFPAHAVSLRGHGGSGGRDQLRRSTLGDYVHDVHQAAVALPRPPILIGHGAGAVVVARVLARYPARAGVLATPYPVGPGLDLLAQTLVRDPVSVLRMAIGVGARARAERLFVDAPDAASLLDRLGPESRRLPYQLALHRAPGRARGGAPMLVVGATRDAVVPARSVLRTARHYRTRPVMLDGVGHDLMLDGGWAGPLATILDWADHVCSPAGAAR